MFRRRNKSASTLDLSREELARREAALREEVEKLQRMIEEAPRLAEELLRRQREELLKRANQDRSRLDVSLVLQDKRYGEFGRGGRPRGSLRKQRREGRISFLVLVIALGAVLLWLASHLRF